MRRATRTPARFAVAVAALAALAALIALSSGAEPSNAGRSKPVVGRAVAIGGSAKITVKSKGGKKHRLREGDRLRLGDVVDPNRHVTAKLKLKIPDDVRRGAQLIYIKPGDKEHHSIILERTGPVRTVVKISD